MGFNPNSVKSVPPQCLFQTYYISYYSPLHTRALYLGRWNGMPDTVVWTCSHFPPQSHQLLYVLNFSLIEPGEGERERERERAGGHSESVLIMAQVHEYSVS